MKSWKGWKGWGRESWKAKGEMLMMIIMTMVLMIIMTMMFRWVEATESRRRLADGREEQLKLRLAVSDKE